MGASRNRSPCLHLGKPLTSSRSFPALSVEKPLEGSVPPPPPEVVEPHAQWTRTPLVPSPVEAPPPSWSHTRTPSPVDNRGHPVMDEARYHTGHLQNTPPLSTPTSRRAPPTSNYTSRKWSCLNLDQPDTAESPNDPAFISEQYSAQPSPSLPVQSPSPSPSPNQDSRTTLPVERWAENVNRYYGSQSTTGGEGAPDEEMSELDTLYQASLLAPSMPRGNRGISPQPSSNKPGEACRSLFRGGTISICCS